VVGVVVNGLIAGVVDFPCFGFRETSFKTIGRGRGQVICRAALGSLGIRHPHLRRNQRAGRNAYITVIEGSVNELMATLKELKVESLVYVL